MRNLDDTLNRRPVQKKLLILGKNWAYLFYTGLNNLHQVTKHAQKHHFAFDTNLLYSSKPLKGINQKINFELKNIVHWLRTNKISFNTKKTEIVHFRAQKTIKKENLNFRISGQKINIMKEIKDLGMVLDEHPTFKNRMDTVKLKLTRTNGLLAKWRHYVNPILLRTMYYAIFDPTCDMDVNYENKHKHKFYKVLEKSKTKP